VIAGILREGNGQSGMGGRRRGDRVAAAVPCCSKAKTDVPWLRALGLKRAIEEKRVAGLVMKAS
jgi:hypothetical protein